MGKKEVRDTVSKLTPKNPLVNDATHEIINNGREYSNINIISWKSFMIVSTHQNIICQNC